MRGVQRLLALQGCDRKVKLGVVQCGTGQAVHTLASVNEARFPRVPGFMQDVLRVGCETNYLVTVNLCCSVAVCTSEWVPHSVGSGCRQSCVVTTLELEH